MLNICLDPYKKKLIFYLIQHTQTLISSKNTNPSNQISIKMKSTPEIINISSDSSSDDETPFPHMFHHFFLLMVDVGRKNKQRRESMIFLCSRISWTSTKLQAHQGVREWCPQNLHRHQNHQKTQIPGSQSDLHPKWNLFLPFFAHHQMRMNLRTILPLLLKDHNHQGQGHHPEQEDQTLLCQRQEKW